MWLFLLEGVNFRMPITSKRTLAAIVFTDIKDFTYLSSQDESSAIQLLEKQRSLVFPLIEEYNGQLRKEMGDGLLITFDTVTDAIRFSINFQNISKIEKNLNIRIGIHEGEISISGNDVFGDDVNITSRIEQYSPIGGIVISNKVQQDISSLSEFSTISIGIPKLKGVKQNIELFCISSHGLPINSSVKISDNTNYFPSKKLISLVILLLLIVPIFYQIYSTFIKSNFELNNSEFLSIAVMLYDNKGKRQLENLAIELTEDTILELSKIGEFIIPTINQVKLMNSNNSINMNYILIGSVSENNNKIILKVRLLNGQSNVALLGEKIIFKLNESDEEIRKLVVSIYNEINPQGGKNEFASTTDIIF